jgi:LPXTG-site transpeptidase (sortase) family protein
MIASKLNEFIISVGLLILMYALSSLWHGLKPPISVDLASNPILSQKHNGNAEQPIDLDMIGDGAHNWLDNHAHLDILEISSKSVEQSVNTLIPITGYETQSLFSHSRFFIARQPEVPIRIAIPAIKLKAPIIPAETHTVKVMGKDFLQWLAPDTFAAGWHQESAKLGEIGNLVLNGHNNLYGEVFKDLDQLTPGDFIFIYSDEFLYQYQITNTMILPEKYQELDMRMQNAQWILPSQDQRLTLVSCWPYTSNSHRVIIVAKPYFSIPAEMD